MIVQEAINWAKEEMLEGRAIIENIGHYVAVENFFDSSIGKTRSMYVHEVVQVLEYFGHKQDEPQHNYIRDRYGSDEYYEYISSNVKVMLKLEKDSVISK